MWGTVGGSQARGGLGERIRTQGWVMGVGSRGSGQGGRGKEGGSGWAGEGEDGEMMEAEEHRVGKACRTWGSP